MDHGVQMSDFPTTNPRPPAYSKGRDGYNALPQHDPTGYHPAPVPRQSGYAPAPPVFQQQSSNTNVVVVGQQPTPRETIVHVRAPRAPEYVLLTGVLMVLCCLHGNLVGILLFLVPALICACAAQDHNNAGDYEGARSFGRASLCCNILSIVYFVLLVLGGIAAVLVYFLYFKKVLQQGSSLDNIANNIVDDLSNTLVCCSYYYDGSCISYCK